MEKRVSILDKLEEKIDKKTETMIMKLFIVLLFLLAAAAFALAMMIPAQ